MTHRRKNTQLLSLPVPGANIEINKLNPLLPSLQTFSNNSERIQVTNKQFLVRIQQFSLKRRLLQEIA